MINNCGRFARCVTPIVTSDLSLHITLTTIIIIIIIIIIGVSLIPAREDMTVNVTLSGDL